MIKNEHNPHHMDIGPTRFPWDGPGAQRSYHAHGTAQAPMWNLILPLLVAENGAALRFDFVLPVSTSYFNFPLYRL